MSDLTVEYVASRLKDEAYSRLAAGDNDLLADFSYRLFPAGALETGDEAIVMLGIEQAREYFQRVLV